MVHKILVTDDDPHLLRVIELNLEAAAYEVVTAPDGEQGLRQFFAQQPDMVILDVSMPKLNGYQVCQRIRDISNIPIIMLTAHTREQDIIKGLDLGADDYLSKPFTMGELLARIRAALRRNVNEATAEKRKTTYSDPYLTVDLDDRRVLTNGNLVKLSPTEYKLLSFLIRHRGRLLEFGQILENVWGHEYTNDIDYLRVYIWHLRQKLEPNPKSPIYLINELNTGYRFEPQI